MMATKYDSVTYYASSDCLVKLTEQYGDRLERMSSADKLALLATLAGFLADDSEDYGLYAASEDCGLRASDEFYVALAILDRVTPNDALSLQIAIANQLKDGVYAA
ncbi:hypothetical protein [Leptolyngbya sp. NIES-2104]|uniref:hypothetical protein n=1 Tax=Leptolyngbya sp. NIES-2104 TaxID=1552121 RepID=UPI0006ECCA79|nr:hypothetical protein [Leptolyngbya sp. NIES-2104]GAQ00124.1 hypothetical protein NIES2104_66890 [Leptolyngbya sp. NIES-2104]